MKSIRFVSSTMAFLLASCAMASDPGDRPAPPAFADIDTNADMYIDREEFSQFSAGMREKVGGNFRSRPGGKSPEDRAARMYDEADVDGDGLLNEEEFNSMQDSMRQRREKMRDRWSDMQRS